MARADNNFSGGLPGDALCQALAGSPCVCSLICSQGALFTQDIKRFPVSQQARELIVDATDNRLPGAGTAPARFWGEIAVSRGGKVGRGPRGMQKRRGNTSWQRAEPTGVADGPRPPPARLGRHKCVSLRVPDWRGITSTEITPGCHSNITSRDMPCCHPATSEGSPGMEGMLRCPRGG